LVLLLPKIYAILLRPFGFIAPKDLCYPVKALDKSLGAIKVKGLNRIG
jgi:hypothetical protein